MKKQERTIDETITDMADLIHLQKNVLEKADELIELRKLQSDVQHAMIDNTRLRLRDSYIVAFTLAIGWLVTLAMFLSKI